MVTTNRICNNMEITQKALTRAGEIMADRRRKLTKLSAAMVILGAAAIAGAGFAALSSAKHHEEHYASHAVMEFDETIIPLAPGPDPGPPE